MNRPVSHSLLVIDDEKSILVLLGIMLSRHEIDVHTATSGEQGIQKLQSHSFDIIITDLLMPGMSGNQFLEQVRRLKGKDLPVIAMSGTPWLVKDSGFDGFLPKPFGREVLIDTIKSFIPSFSN